MAKSKKQPANSSKRDEDVSLTSDSTGSNSEPDANGGQIRAAMEEPGEIDSRMQESEASITNTPPKGMDA